MSEYSLQHETDTTDDTSPQSNPYDLADSDTCEEINRRINKVLSTDRFSRTLFSRDWFRNILFYVGAQWIVYSKGRWRQRELPDWFPRAQTNKFAEKWNSLVSQLVTGRRVPITYEPADVDDPQSVAIADSGATLRDVMYAEAKVDEKEYEIASWVIGTGNCFGIPQYDMSQEHGVQFIQFQQCSSCGDNQIGPEQLAANNGACGCGDPTSQLSDAFDEDGNPLGDEYPIGALNLDVVGPFEIRLDQRITDVGKQQRFVRLRRYDTDWAREQWPKYKDIIQPDTTGGDDPEQFYLDVISHITSGFNVGAGILADGTNSKTPKTTAYEFYELPSEKFPQGMRAVRIGKSPEAMVEVGPLPTQYGAGTKKGKYFLPLIHWGFDYVPGRLFRKTRLDDLIAPQLFRNIVEANIRLTTQRMGNGIWMVPKGSGVEIITGEPGQKIDYNPVSLGGTSFAKPERVPAELSNIGPLVTILKVIDDEMERVAGTFYQGQTPPGVTAASALAYLGEQKQQAMSSLVASWAKSWRVFDMYMLEIARANWDEVRLRVILGKNKKWQAQSFSKADLQGAVNLVIDYNGMFPKSQATERATIGQLTQMGMVNPQDPEMRTEVLKKFGASDLQGSVNDDITYAAKLYDKFMSDQSGTYMPTLRPNVDNSKIMFQEGVKLAKTDEFLELPQERQDAFIEFLSVLTKDIVTKQVVLGQMGLDPNSPALEETPSAEAILALQQTQMEQQMLQQQQAEAQAAQQNGGAPNGAQGPDARLDAQGNPLPPSTQPDIAAPGQPNVPGGATSNVNSPDAGSINLPGQRAIPIPGGGTNG